MNVPPMSEAKTPSLTSGAKSKGGLVGGNLRSCSSNSFTDQPSAIVPSLSLRAKPLCPAARYDVLHSCCPCNMNNRVGGACFCSSHEAPVA
jgi:hypothetical protein